MARGVSHHDWIELRSVRDVLYPQSISDAPYVVVVCYEPTSVEVPGGVASLTSSFDRLNAPFREVMVKVQDEDIMGLIKR